MTTSLPAGSIAGEVDRWELITQDTLPAYRDLILVGAVLGAGETYRRIVGDGIGPSGLAFEVEASLKGGIETYRYAVILDPALYTPEAQDVTRRTGMFPPQGKR